MPRTYTPRRIFPILLVSLLALFLAACGGGDDEAEEIPMPAAEQPQPEPEAEPGQSLILSPNQNRSPSLNPNLSQSQKRSICHSLCPRPAVMGLLDCQRPAPIQPGSCRFTMMAARS